MRYDQLLAEEKVLIAGDPGELRQAIAGLFAAQGAEVAILGGPEGPSPDGAAGLYFPADLARGDAVADACQAALAALGHVDVLVNLFTAHRPALAHACPEDEMADTLHRGLLPALLCVQQAAQGMMERCHGSVVNVLPIYALHTVPGVAATAGAAGGLHAFSKAIAMDYCRFAVRSNCLLYSGSFLDGNGQAGRWTSTQPIRRRGTAEEIAGAALYLACDMSKHVTGETLLADGGATLLAHKQIYA